jgi:uncharacterized protein YbjT (DUF2867 family)
VAAKAVVLGGYGLIGSACCRALAAQGFAVTAIGRSRAAARCAGAKANWIFCDIARTDASQWRRILAGADVVVNASGALQDGARDNLSAIHDKAIGALIAALEGGRTRFIQISAAGVSASAPTEFLRSKARGDARLASSSLDWVILRPTLVISPDAFGGTALLRAAAAFPLVFARVYPNAPVQTVWIGDVTQAVVTAAQGKKIAGGTIADLTEAPQRSFAETIARFRRWLGFAEWRATFDMPRPLIAALGLIADALGWLGWRSPLRSGALRSLRSGIVGDPDAWINAGGARCRPLDDTLALIPATAQERRFALLYFLLPLAIGVLALFWIGSGAIALANPAHAADILLARGVSDGVARAVVFGGAGLDIALGLAILIRPLARFACLAMIIATLGYLAGSAVLAPDLWLDPLAPMLKATLSIPLALFAAALAADR